MSNLPNDFYSIIKNLSQINNFDGEEIEKNYKKLLLFYNSGNRHSYSAISSIIFKMENDEDNEIMAYCGEKLCSLAKNDPRCPNDICKKFEKLLDHINLAIQQKAYIHQNIELFKIKNDKLEGKIDGTAAKFNETFKNMRKKLSDVNEEINESRSKIYSEFIGILGIFSAIVLAAFGGLQILQNVLGNINHISVSKLMIFCGLTIFAIINLIFITLYGIARLTNKSIKRCSCDEKNITCEHSALYKYPILVTSSFVSLFVSAIGVLRRTIRYDNLFMIYITFGPFWTDIIIFVCVVILFFVSVLYYLRLKKRDQAFNEMIHSKDKTRFSGLIDSLRSIWKF